MPLFTCDELTPSLCDLRATNGSLAVRGLEVQYTHYHAVNPDRSKLPIVMVHGGPGWSHHYMLPLKQQACRGRDVFFYDQAGAGTSERPAPSSRVAAPWLFDLSYYPEEMMAVVAHLGLARHHVLGSSWGTIVAQLYALRHPLNWRASRSPGRSPTRSCTKIAVGRRRGQPRLAPAVCAAAAARARRRRRLRVGRVQGDRRSPHLVLHRAHDAGARLLR